MNKKRAIEPYGGGFIVADFSGKRGKFGEAYTGRDGQWRDQPSGMLPFPSQEAAQKWSDENP